MLVFWLALACNNAELEAERTQLQQRVEDLERANGRLEKDNAALKSQVARTQAEEAGAARTAALGKLGLTDGKKLHATLKTSMGEIHCVLRHDQAPETVRNFVELARGDRAWTDPKSGEEVRRPLYDGTIFHRVIPEFMIQGGDPLGRGTGGPGYTFADEVGDFTVFDKPGLLAMANSGPNTNGSQFFITEGTPAHLNGKHTIFGDCDNLDVVKAIARVPTGRNDKPVTDVVLEKVTVEAR